MCHGNKMEDKFRKNWSLDGPNMSAVAMFLGAALYHPVPRCNGIRPWSSTIKVLQYKIKFGDIRIYCRLASNDLVKDLWKTFEKNYELSNANDEPTESFIYKCLVHDAKHYRYCYMSMKSLLQSDDYDQLLSCADYRELLLSNEADLDKYIKNFHPTQLENKMQLYKCKNEIELRDFLIKIMNSSC